MNIIKQIRSRIEPVAQIDCPTRKNPNYWLNKLRHKHNILQQAKYRNLEIKELWRLPNKSTILILINCDCAHNQTNNNPIKYRAVCTIHQVLMSQHQKHTVLVGSAFNLILRHEFKIIFVGLTRKNLQPRQAKLLRPFLLVEPLPPLAN